MRFRLVQELAVDGVPVAVACRELGVSPSGYYEWRGRVPSARAVVDAALSTQIVEIHTMSRGSYGVPRMHLELRLGRGVRCGRKRIARLMRAAHVQGISRRHGKRHRPLPAVHDDLVRRRFMADAPDRLWLTDITEHLCAELVVDALEMARWRRRPQPGQTVVHSDRGSQYTAWAFGQRLRSAGLLGSMGRVASALDNSMMESFFGTMQRELLDRKAWATRSELARAIFEWIEGWYNPRRRHTSIGGLSPVEYERSRQATSSAA